MRCIKCGAELTDPGYCSACGTEIQVYQKFFRLSNTYYNRGLEKAQVRNLSGAIQDLRYSLELNKRNIPARNLLGLVYFEIGEVVSALTEWIISKNLEPEKNIADEYIQSIQANAGRLQTINQTIKKYNQSLLYCQQGSGDLAIIQLKKVLSLNPKLVKAHQLLALLYIQTEEYDRAGRELKRALAVDRADTISLHYQAEWEALTGKRLYRGGSAEKEKRQPEQKSDIISYTSGNETIIMPTSSYKENKGVSGIVNIIVGLALGAGLMGCLVMPAKVQSVRSEANTQIREYSDQISAKQSEIDSLQTQLTQLQESSEEETAEEETTVSGYELVIDAYTLLQAGDTEGATAAIDQVSADELSDNAKNLYYQVYGSVHAEEIAALYEAGETAYKAANYEEAVTDLEPVAASDETYNNGYALYYLGRSYENLGQNDQAIDAFQRFVAAFPGTERASYCTNALARLGAQ